MKPEVLYPWCPVGAYLHYGPNGGLFCVDARTRQSAWFGQFQIDNLPPSYNGTPLIATLLLFAVWCVMLAWWRKRAEV